MDNYAWQTKEIEEHGADLKRGLFADPRLGKTLCAVRQTERWDLNGPILVVAPLSVCPTWASTIDVEGSTMPYKAPEAVLGYIGTSKARNALVGQIMGQVTKPTYRQFFLTNYESLSWLPATGWGGLILDESHYIKGPNTDRGNAARRIAKRTKYVRLLTGTPAPNHYGDLWGQLAALDPKEWGTYASFRRRYLLCHPMFPTKVLEHINTDELQARMMRYVSIVRREDVFGPDTWQVVHRHVTLPLKARKLYDSLAKNWIADVEGGQVDAAHILKRLIRLQQVAAGYVPTEDGEVIDVHSAKLDAVEADLIEIVQSREKAVIFHRFTREGEAYLKLAEKLAPCVIQISGKTPVEDREAQRLRFQNYSGAAIAVVQTQAGGIGISFSEATHALFVSRSFSYTEDNQALARIYKPGAVRVATYYECDRTVDAYIAQTLNAKRNVHESVTHADHRSMVWGEIR